MREHYRTVFKAFVHDALLKRRMELDISQEEMAVLLAMSARGYSKLEHGECSCCGLTLALYLIHACEDPIEFLEDLLRELEDFCAEAG